MPPAHLMRWSGSPVRYMVIILALCSTVYAHSEDIFPDQAAIIKRQQYADNLQIELKTTYKQSSVSLFGEELEHVLIISAACVAIKNYLLTGARQLGILSARCRWYNNQFQLRIPK